MIDKFWSDKDKERIAQLYKKGDSFQHIATFFKGKSRGSIAGVVYRLGLCQPKEKKCSKKDK